MGLVQVIANVTIPAVSYFVCFLLVGALVARYIACVLLNGDQLWLASACDAAP